MNSAWGAIHALGARRPLAAALAPALGLARDGMEVVPGLAAAIAEDRDLLHADEGLAALFLDGGAPRPAGSTVRQPALARTLEAIAADGPAALYGGEVGRALVARLQALGSAMTLDDLASHRTDVVDAVGLRALGVDVLTAPPNSQGLLAPLILRARELGEVADPLGADAGLTAALFWRAGRIRETLLTDPRAMGATAAELLDDAHVERVLADARAVVAGGGTAAAPSREPNGDTIGLVAADADGWRVVIIQSIYYGWGSGILDPATGILCQNRGAHFSLDPAAVNVLRGGKRTAHTLMPLLLRRDGAIVGVHGTMGGTAQAQIHAQLVLRVLGGLDAAAAVDAPRMVVGRNRSEPDDITLLEARLPAAARAAVRAAGMPLVELDAYSDDAGHSHVIRVLPDGLDVGTDPRADGAAVAG